MQPPKLIFSQLMDWIHPQIFRRIVQRHQGDYKTYRFAIVKKELQLEPSLYEILQILSVTPFEQIPLQELLTKAYDPNSNSYDCNQLPLW